MGLTFLMAPDTIGISDRFPTASIPVSVVIDRFGTVCLIEGSAKTDSETFTRLFDIFIGDDYTESILLPIMNAELPSVEPASSEELSGALDSDLIFTNSTNPYNWPMTVAEKEGRTVLVSENYTCPGSVSALNTTVEAKAGDALVISFKMGAEAPMDRMTLFVNGEAVKYFGSTRDWGTYAHTFGRDGAYDVRICYSKEIYSRDKNAYLWIDSIQLLSGDEAAAALEQNPRYIVSPETSIQLLNEDARLVVVYLEADPDIMSYYYILDGVWNVKATLDETVDPELTYFRDSQLRNYSLLEYQKEDGYYIDFTPPESEISFFLDVVMGNDYISLSGFVDEEAADELCALFKYYSGRTYCWKYADETVDAAAVAGDATYTITYTDQNGNPVQGVMCQVCDESTCQVFVSGSDGVCTITLPAGVYEIHTLKVPEGYEGDTATVTETPVGGGELSFVLTKK
ncbi:MAG: hypothetical protein IJC48_04295 [Clostridia bacterium]|nr:hypothetical protein [Clostridia bacterium]